MRTASRTKRHTGICGCSDKACTCGRLRLQERHSERCAAAHGWLPVSHRSPLWPLCTPLAVRAATSLRRTYRWTQWLLLVSSASFAALRLPSSSLSSSCSHQPSVDLLYARWSSTRLVAAHLSVAIHEGGASCKPALGAAQAHFDIRQHFLLPAPAVPVLSST